MRIAVAINLGLWRGRSPGEGLFPFITAAGMIVFSIAGWPADGAAWPRARRERSARARTPSATAILAHGLLRRGAAVLRADAGKPRLHRRTIVSVAAILRFAERYSWIATLAIAIGAAAACHVLFGFWLGAILPTGTLWERVLLADGPLAGDRARLLDRAHLVEPRLLLHRRVRRHRGRRAAGPRAGRDDLAAAAVLVHDGHRLGADPDGRHVLRRAVRRLDHRHPGAHSGRSVHGRHLPRRLRDGAAGPRRRGARHRGVRLVHRRRAGDHRAVPRRAGAGQCRARVRAGRIHRAGAARPAAGDAALLRLADQRAADGRVRPAAFDRRQATRSTAPSASPSASSRCSTGSTSRCSRWAFSASPNCW